MSETPNETTPTAKESQAAPDTQAAQAAQMEALQKLIEEQKQQIAAMANLQAQQAAIPKSEAGNTVGEQGNTLQAQGNTLPGEYIRVLSEVPELAELSFSDGHGEQQTARCTKMRLACFSFEPLASSKHFAEFEPETIKHLQHSSSSRTQFTRSHTASEFRTPQAHATKVGLQEKTIAKVRNGPNIIILAILTATSLLAKISHCASLLPVNPAQNPTTPIAEEKNSRTQTLVAEVFPQAFPDAPFLGAQSVLFSVVSINALGVSHTKSSPAHLVALLHLAPVEAHFLELLHWTLLSSRDFYFDVFDCCVFSRCTHRSSSFPCYVDNNVCCHKLWHIMLRRLHHRHGKVRLRHCVDRFRETLTWFFDRRFRTRLHHMITGNRGHWLQHDSNYFWIPFELRQVVKSNKLFLPSTQFVSINTVVVSVWSFTTHSWIYAKDIWNLPTSQNECYCSSQLFQFNTFKPLNQQQVLVLGTKNAMVEFVYTHSNDFDTHDITAIFFPEQMITSFQTDNNDHSMHSMPGAIPLTGTDNSNSRAIPKAVKAHQAIPGHKASLVFPGAMPITGKMTRTARQYPMLYKPNRQYLGIIKQIKSQGQYP